MRLFFRSLMLCSLGRYSDKECGVHEDCCDMHIDNERLRFFASFLLSSIPILVYIVLLWARGFGFSPGMALFAWLLLSGVVYVRFGRRYGGAVRTLVVMLLVFAAVPFLPLKSL